MGFRLISVLQRVDSGSVKVKNKTVGNINRGFVILLGISKSDKETDADYLVEKIHLKKIPVETGEFGAEMKVDLVNNGPVTLVLDSNQV